MASLPTTDLSDANEPLLDTGDLRPLKPIFNIYGLKRTFHGRVVTVKVFEDNGLIIKLLTSSPAYGPGSVLVIDGGGSQGRAVMGSLLTGWGCKSGWGGVVVNGYIRDVDEINSLDIGVRALGTFPVRPRKTGAGESRVPVNVAGHIIHDGDGVLVSKNLLDLANLPDGASDLLAFLANPSF